MRDRDGDVLRITLSPDQKFRIRTPLRDISPELIDATLQFLENEYGADDFNKFTAVADRADAIASLDRATHGVRRASPRYRELMAPMGLVGVIAGWLTTEVGRQPWTVYGIMRTADSVSPSLTGQDVLISLIGYAIVYLIIFPFGLVLMGRLVRIGPLGIGLQPEPVESGRPDLPVRALPSAEPELLP